MASQDRIYDFIVVGAGPAGCLAASTLAASKKQPQVLLIEAGGKNDNRTARIDAEKWISRMNPSQNWGYKSVPQKSMNDRVLDYDRGRGLGGSSAINFSAWTIAPAEDHDEIARLTGDDEWKWHNAQQRYKRIESYHGKVPHVPSGMEKYLSPNAGDHGDKGPIKVGFPVVWEKSYVKEMDAFRQAGYPSNPDINNGSNIGVGCVPNTAFRGVRTTAADALRSASSNLHVLTDSQVARVLFEGKTATGVTLLDGTTLSANKEIIISAGSIDSPKILLHSGIGPAEQLNEFGIPVIDDNEGIGKNLQEHPFIFLQYPRHEDVSRRLDYYRDPEAQAKARAQWEKDATGPLAEIACQLCTIFTNQKSVLQTAEFEDLPSEMKAFIRKPNVPTCEYMLNLPNLDVLVDPANAPNSAWFACFLMNPMSRGQVFLTSADPADPIAIDVNMLSHPFDQRNAIEAAREFIKIAHAEPESKIDQVQYLAPNGDGDEDILEFWKATAGVTWHATGTVKMGKDVSEAGVCVDQNFRVRNVARLRVADLSVVPFVTNNHTQATAYLVGTMLGDRLIDEYGLND